MVCIPSAGNLAAVLAAAAAAAAAALPLCHTITAGGGREASRARAFDSREDVAMEGNGAGGGSGSSAPPWDLGMHWAPASSSSYPQPPFAPPRPGGGASHQYYQLQELTCLKLGKRPCCWAGAAGSQQLAQAGAAGPLAPVHGNGSAAAGGSTAATTEGRRKEKAAPAAGSGAAAVARCQVEGCHAELAGAKEYHRRHKVCEAHSKAPRVVVLGAEQRFCQQCSRFHAISEFDDVKRSCRRRLAGHNERRRKSNASEAMARGAAHPHGVPPFGHGFLPPCGLAAPPAGALSLLSSARGGAPCLVPAPDISARSSAALDELIAENRAALLASWQFFSSDRSAAAAVRHLAAPPSSGRDVLPPADPAPGWHHHPHNGAGGGRYYHATAAASAGHTTLDLMQTAAATTAASAGAAFRPVPERAATATATATRPPKTRDGDAAGCSSPGAWAPAGGARAL